MPGFLDVGTKNCAGNCGLRDQLLAIKWVKENIKQFGGNPENITIFGESSGAMAIYFHLLSPMSKGKNSDSDTIMQKISIQTKKVSTLVLLHMQWNRPHKRENWKGLARVSAICESKFNNEFIFGELEVIFFILST